MAALTEPQERMLTQIVVQGSLAAGRSTGARGRALERRGLITVRGLAGVSAYVKSYVPTEAGAEAVADAAAFMRPLHQAGGVFILDGRYVSFADVWQRWCMDKPSLTATP